MSYTVLFFSVIYILSLHDALPIYRLDALNAVVVELFIPEAVYDDIVIAGQGKAGAREVADAGWIRRTHLTDTSSADRLSDRKSTRLNSSHITISYGVFCLKKKKST